MGAVSSYATDTPDPTDFVLGTDSGGTVKRFAMRGVARTAYVLTTLATLSTTATVVITDGTTPWTHTCVAGKTYRFIMTATHQTAATATGLRLSIIAGGGAAGQLNGMFYGALAQAAASTGLEATLFAFATSTTVWPAGSSLLTTAVAPATSPHHCGLEFIFRCTTGGTVSIHFGSEVAASAVQINQGSALIVEELV
jgi:hypothetical protein